MILDELVDLDEERLMALEVLTKQKERVAKAYNKKVKSKLFAQGDLVWKVILPMDKKSRVSGNGLPVGKDHGKFGEFFRIMRMKSKN
jgi:hypothetical protein